MPFSALIRVSRATGLVATVGKSSCQKTTTRAYPRADPMKIRMQQSSDCAWKTLSYSVALHRATLFFILGQANQRTSTGIVVVTKFHPLISIRAGPFAALAGYSISISRASPGKSDTYCHSNTPAILSPSAADLERELVGQRGRGSVIFDLDMNFDLVTLRASNWRSSARKQVAGDSADRWRRSPPPANRNCPKSPCRLCHSRSSLTKPCRRKAGRAPA